MSTNQFRLNPSQSVSNFKGRHELTRAWPSTAVSTWHNGGLFGGKWSYTAGDADETNTYDGRTAYVFTSSGTLTVTAGYVDIFMIGGGGEGFPGHPFASGTIGGGGGAGGVLYLEDVYMKAGVWDVTVGGQNSETFIYEDGNTSAPLTDSRMDSHGTAASNLAVAASEGGGGNYLHGESPAGTHSQTDSQKGSGGGGGTGVSVGTGSSSDKGNGGTSGDIGRNGANGFIGSGYWGAGAGGSAGGNYSGNSSYAGAQTDAGIGVTNTHRSAGQTSAYYAVGGSADLWTSIWVSSDNKCDDSNYEDIGGHSAWQTSDSNNNGATNTGSGGGGGYTVSGSGSSGICIFITRAEDA